MRAEKYLQLLQQDIHSVIFATTDGQNLPVTCVIDIILADKNGLYFLTAKGKAFYSHLKAHPFISLTRLKKNAITFTANQLLRVEKCVKSNRDD